MTPRLKFSVQNYRKNYGSPFDISELMDVQSNWPGGASVAFKHLSVAVVNIF